MSKMGSGIALILHDERRQVLIVALAACLVYCNVINAPFLHDDAPAILSNPDVQGRTKLSELFVNDFWGDSMRSNVTHKSYRPITVLLFRCLHKVWENWTTPYHVTNIILHAIVAVLLFFVCKRVVFDVSYKLAPFIASLLFALHPIHSEAVCGVVGCAELLSAICFMAAILVFAGNEEKPNENTFDEVLEERNATQVHKYSRSKENVGLRQRRKVTPSNKTYFEKVEKNSKHATYNCRLIVCLLIATTGMLCKESGFTVLGILLVYDVLVNKLNDNSTKLRIFHSFYGIFSTKKITIVLWGWALVIFRLWIMQWTKPLYFIEENPASYEKEMLTRFLTYWHLCWFNFRLLIWPVNLSYDYSYDTIPLITTIWDPRNVASLMFLLLSISMGVIALFGFYAKKIWSKQYIMGISMMIFPFLPASNLFFPVGFVVAERILYLPSAGFLVLIVLLWSKALQGHSLTRRLLQGGMIMVICLYFVQTFNRNFAWTSQERLFRSGMDVYPQNAKIRYNWGTQLQTDGRWSEAAAQFEMAIELYPQGYYSAINNLGIAYEKIGKPSEVLERIFIKAIKLKPNAGTAYYNLGGIYTKQNRPNDMLRVMADAADKVNEQFSKLIPITREAAKHYKSAELEHIHFKLLKNFCFRDIGARIEDECCSNVIPTLYDYAKVLAEKRETTRFQIVQQQIGHLRIKDETTIQILLQSLPLVRSIEELSSIMAKNGQTQQNRLK